TNRRFLPAFERDVDGLDAGLLALTCRQVINLLAVKLVADADLQFVEAVQHVELGKRDAGDTVGGDRLAHQSSVEPAAAALAARHGAEFTALFAKELADLVGELGRARAFADPGRVSLGDAENIAERARPHAGT